MRLSVVAGRGSPVSNFAADMINLKIFSINVAYRKVIAEVSSFTLL